MSTSGTIATTSIDTAAVVEHAFRRCRVLPSAQTPETVLIAKENLYLILLNLSNRGLNLWAVEKAFIGLNVGQATYATPSGTLDVLNVVYCTPTLVTNTFAVGGNGGTATFASSDITRIGFTVSTSYTGTIVLSYSTDSVTYTVSTVLPSATYEAGQYYWADLPAAVTATNIAVEGTAVAPITAIKVATVTGELPVTAWNRDTYAVINQKTKQGHPSTSYFYEKKLIPEITLWPVPDSTDNHLMIYRHRQVQDVGTLIQTLECPQRWLDGIIWLLAAKLAFELPTVDMALVTMLQQMADKQEFEMEQSETDGAPMYIQPGISCYSR
jgi:hypothetical protein